MSKTKDEKVKLDGRWNEIKEQKQTVELDFSCKKKHVSSTDKMATSLGN